MGELQVTDSVVIDAPEALVRAQFADVAHHERTAPHAGVRFRVLDDDATACSYTQTTSIGPFRTSQTMRLEHHAVGPLVNQVTRGLLVGGTITFTSSAAPDGATVVVAEINAPSRGLLRFAAPLVRRAVQRSLHKALLEDKHDLESGNYPSQTTSTS